MMTDDLLPLRDEIADQPSVAALLIRLLDREHVIAAPLPVSARLAFVAAAYDATSPLLLLTTTSEVALRARDDLAQWLGPGRVFMFPASDALPYEAMSPAADVTVGRLAVLRALAAGETPLVVVPVKALTQPTLAPAELAALTVPLAQGAQFDPEQLAARLVALGYRTAPVVEEPGEWNRRGGIVDVFVPGDEAPLRIEFFGDEVDSLRRFDPITQRSDTRVTAASIGPAFEFDLTRRTTAAARLRALATDGMRREVRDEWDATIASVEAGERVENRSLLAPFFRDTMPTLLDHLPPDASLLLNDSEQIVRHLTDLDTQASERRATQVVAGELPHDYPRPYLRWQDLEPQIAQRGTAHMHSGDGDLPDGLFAPPDLFAGQLRRLVADIIERLQQDERVVIVTPQAARLTELVHEAWRGVPAGFSAIHGALDGGLRAAAIGLTLYTDSEIFGFRARRTVGERRRRRDKSAEERAAFLRGLNPGDFVVHIEHGIARYEGMVRRTVGALEREYLNLTYADGDRLYVPVDQIDRISRYIGAGDADPQLTRLGTQEWERAKRKARAAVQDLADDLLKIYAQRSLAQGHAFAPDNEWQRDLEASFAFIETDDQLKAIQAVKADMERLQPMDRLVCGDVGFGKTEVALRAAFKAVQDGLQVAVLVPTTVLARQHYETFSRRMAAFPVRVEMLSRFRSPKEQAEIVRGLGNGSVDIVIGTHRLLSKDIGFKKLGLLVIDEEQRFGVRHKERFKQMRANVDVLTLTATPIPRTLHMALAGIRDLSVIDTPPEDRLPIKTYVQPFDEHLVREAILRELDRDGQVFFVHNRVHDIYYVADKLRTLVPEAEISVGHGQLGEDQLERVMLDFYSGKDDVLVCTTIIESGLDVPNANTMIIDEATNYGLAQLYQLRGRVGRSAQRAYAYMLYRAEKPMTQEAHDRLDAIRDATELGAGFRIAMRDLEIRGAGNLLGAEQSGQIAAVGFDLYSRLLEQAVKMLKAQFDAGAAEPAPAPVPVLPGQPGVSAPAADVAELPAARKRATIKVDEKVLVSPLVTVDLPLDAYLPPEYIPDERVRLAMYQHMATANTSEMVRALRQDLRDRFGELPSPAEQLVTWLNLKALALRAGVASVVTADEEFIVRLPEGELAARARLQRRYGRDPNVKIGPQFLRIDRRARNAETTWLATLTAILETLAGDAEPVRAARVAV